jgi:UDP-N-acetylglucosamine transferase subunit ALG13
VIFVTVGAQMAFDRLVGGVDDWAGARGRKDVFAQVGPTEAPPKHIEWTRFLDPPEFRKRVQEARVIVAHAGMGSILTALEVGKPILVMPRRGDLRETRNDHQVATAERFLSMGRVHVAMDETQLPARLDEIDGLVAADRISRHASDELLRTLRSFIAGEPIEDTPAPRA